MQPLSSFQNPGIYSGNKIQMYGDGSNIMRFQTTPVRWESGRGGSVPDVVLRERLAGVDAQVNAAIAAFWEAEAMTERQLLWNRQTLTDTPLPNYRDNAQRVYAQYADDHHRKKKRSNTWMYAGAAALGLYLILR